MLALREWVCGSMLLALALTCAPASAFEPLSKEKVGPRFDAQGDPLPHGAVARIGTVRLRQPSEVCSVVFSPNGKLLATGGRRDGVHLWDSTTGKSLRFLPAEKSQGIFYLSFSPDGKSLVTSGRNALEVWDVASGKRHRQLAGESDLGPLCFSDDGKLLAAANGNTMRVWDTAGWTERKGPRLDDQNDLLHSFAGKRMYVGNEKVSDYLWDLASLRKQAVPQEWRIGHWTALSADGKQLAASGWKSSLVVLREVASGKVLHRLALEKKKKDATVSALCYSPDGKLLAIGGRGISLHCISSETGKETTRFPDQEVDYSTQLAFSPDGKRLAVGNGHTIRIWDIGTGKELLPTREILQGIQAVAFSLSGKWIAFGDGKWLRLYDSATHKQMWRVAEEWDNAQRIAFAPDGKSLVAGNISRLRFLDALTGDVTHSWGKGLGSFGRVGDPIELGLFTPGLEKVVSLQIAPFRDPSTDVTVRSAKTGADTLKFERRRGRATAACISPNGRLLAIGDWAGPTQLYHMGSGKWAGQVGATGTGWHNLVFAPDSRSLASMSPDGAVQLLEVATGRTRVVLSESGQREHFAYSLDGTVLAAWENDAIELWDTLTGRKLGRLEGHAGRIRQVAFMPGGNILATASDDTTILLWELAGLTRAEKPIAVTADELTSAWNDFADPSAARACRAMSSLRRAGSLAVAFLREQLRPESMPAAKQIKRWLKDLDHPEFSIRKDAAQQLERQIDVSLDAVRKALAAGPPLEARRRLNQLIAMAEEGRWAPEALRALRAIEVLEQIGSAEARTLLGTLSGGTPSARLTREAKASLERLAR